MWSLYPKEGIEVPVNLPKKYANCKPTGNPNCYRCITTLKHLDMQEEILEYQREGVGVLLHLFLPQIIHLCEQHTLILQFYSHELLFSSSLTGKEEFT